MDKTKVTENLVAFDEEAFLLFSDDEAKGAMSIPRRYKDMVYAYEGFKEKFRK